MLIFSLGHEVDYTSDFGFLLYGCIIAEFLQVGSNENKSKENSNQIELVYNNTPAGSGYAPAWAKCKFPIQQHPLSFECFTKTDLYGMDTVSIEIDVFNNGIKIDSGYWESTTTINQWQNIIVPITQSGSQVDSIEIKLIGGIYLKIRQILNIILVME